MINRARKWQDDWQWFVLLSITVLVNVPMLSPTLLIAGDALHAFSFFHFAYSDLILHHEVARWLPYIGYGMVFDFNLFNSIQPTDYVMMAVGWLFGIRNALLLYKISLILCEAVLVMGLYVLSRRLFTSRLTVWMVCLGGLLTTNSFYTTAPFSLTAYYMVPLVLWFMLRFLDSKNPAFLWVAGLTEGVSLLGTVPYIAPLHLFIDLAFLVPYLCRDPRLWRALVNWRTFVHPLFFAFCGYYLLVGLWIAGIDAAWTAPGREKSGNVSLAMFLGREPGYELQPLGTMLRLLVKGDCYYGEAVNYAGILPLLGLFYALLRRRDTLFLSLACIALALFWFSLGGWFSTLTYYCVPMMNKLRFITAAWNFLRIFLILLGGFGFDQLLSDLRGLPAPAPGFFSLRERWAILILLACCALDHLFNSNAAFYTNTDFLFHGLPHPEIFSRQNADIRLAGFKTDSQTILGIRYLAHAAILGLLWLWLLAPRLRRDRGESAVAIRVGNWAWAVGPVLLTLYLADVGFYFSQYVKQCPWCPPGTAVEEALTVRDTMYRFQRYEPDFPPFLAANTLGLIEAPVAPGPLLAVSACYAWRLHKLPPDAERIRQVLLWPRSGIAVDNFLYGSTAIIMQADNIVPWERLDLMMAGVKKMIDVRLQMDEPMPVQVAHDLPLRRSLGEGLDKARMVHDRDVIITDSEYQALDVFRQLPNPDQKIVIQGTPRQRQGEESASFDRVEPLLFTANRVVFKVPSGASGWLFYADGYHPAWKAKIDGHAAEVFRANIGFKAVQVPQGARQVEFYFDAGLRDVHCLAFVAVAAALAFLLTGLLLAAPWVLKTEPVPVLVKVPATEGSPPSADSHRPPAARPRP